MIKKGGLKSSKKALTQKQLTLLKSLMDYETNDTVTRACQTAGVDRASYYNWMNEPYFVDALTRLRNKALAAMSPRIDAAMVKMAQFPSHKGTGDRRLFYELRKEIKSESNSQPITVIISSPRPQR